MVTSNGTLRRSEIATLLRKVAEVTIWFWIITILATTVGETAADFLADDLDLGLTNTTYLMGVVLAIVLVFQFRADRYVPGTYWLAVALISIVGTLITDDLVENLGVSRVVSTSVFAVALAVCFVVWLASEGTLSIHSIRSPKREAFYWLTILFTFALGTAAGDLLAEQLDVGYWKSALIFAGVIALVVAAHFVLELNPIREGPGHALVGTYRNRTNWTGRVASPVEIVGCSYATSVAREHWDAMSPSSAAGDRHVLIVEDDATIGSAMTEALEAHGLRVTLHTRGSGVAEFVAASTPDLVLLDAGLPDIDGFTLCRQLRTARPELPIILVTARDADIDIVVGLDAGADDYVTKPFSMTVLLARVRAQLRTVDPPDPDAAITLGDLRIDPAAYTASLNGVPMDLRPREFQLLLYLVREVGRVVTRDRLLADLWDLHWDSSTKTVDMHIVAVRRKLGSSLEIVTVRGVGYRLVAP